MSKGDFLEGQLDGLLVNEETANSVRAFWKAVNNHEVELSMKVTSNDFGGVIMEVIRDGWHMYLEFTGSEIQGSMEGVIK